MADRVFLDTGFAIALNHDSDQHHADAIQEWERLAARAPELVTTSFVLVETMAFLVSRGMHAVASEVGTFLLDGTHMVHVDEPLARAGFDLLRRRPDKTYSLTDCVSFVLMQKLGITEALAFDAHFTRAGFVRLPFASA